MPCINPGTALVSGSKIAPHFFSIGFGAWPSSIGYEKIKSNYNFVYNSPLIMKNRLTVDGAKAIYSFTSSKTKSGFKLKK
jgi:hypothetical protein